MHKEEKVQDFKGPVEGAHSILQDLKTNLLSVPSKVEEMEREGVLGGGCGGEEGGGISVFQSVETEVEID